MPLDLVDLGTAGVPNSGDAIRDGGEKINANFEYLDTRMDSIETNVEDSLEQAQTAASDAEAAALDAQEAAALANAYQGTWSSATGAATKGSSYSHNGFAWMLLVDVANIAATEPSNSNSDWLLKAGGTSTAYDVVESNTDDTADRVLLTGATVHQFDTQNSNIAYVPSVQATSYSDFVANEYHLYGVSTGVAESTFADNFALTRTTSKTLVSPTGTIETVSADTPAFTYSEGVSEGLNLSGSYTNAITWSEDFTNADWIKSTGASASATTDASPVDGVNWARVTAGSGGYIRQVKAMTPSATGKTIYAVVKYDGSSTVASIRTAFTGGTAVFEQVSIDLLTGQTSSNSSGAISLGQGGWLFFHTLTDNGTNSTADLRLYPTDFASINSSDTVLFAVAQFTETGHPMPYVPTTMSSATVTQDDVYKTLGKEFNSSEITLFSEFRHPYDYDQKVATRSAIHSVQSAQPSNSSDYFGFFRHTENPDMRLMYRSDGGQSIVLKTFTELDLTQNVRAACSIDRDGNVSYAAYDGITLVSGTTAATIDLSNCVYESITGDSGVFSGLRNDKKRAMYPKALTLSELEKMVTKGVKFK